MSEDFKLFEEAFLKNAIENICLTMAVEVIKTSRESKTQERLMEVVQKYSKELYEKLKDKR